MLCTLSLKKLVATTNLCKWFRCTAIQNKCVTRPSSCPDQYYLRERTHLASKVLNLEALVALEAGIAAVSVEVIEVVASEAATVVVSEAASAVGTEVVSVAEIEVASVVVHQEAVSERQKN